MENSAGKAGLANRGSRGDYSGGQISPPVHLIGEAGGLASK